tara:strand:+ start:1500 stop:3482 length:1983 start_codon:yes stop_codon:yes gene_type:complete
VELLFSFLLLGWHRATAGLDMERLSLAEFAAQISKSSGLSRSDTEIALTEEFRNCLHSFPNERGAAVLRRAASVESLATKLAATTRDGVLDLDASAALSLARRSRSETLEYPPARSWPAEGLRFAQMAMRSPVDPALRFSGILASAFLSSEEAAAMGQRCRLVEFDASAKSGTDGRLSRGVLALAVDDAVGSTMVEVFGGGPTIALHLTYGPAPLPLYELTTLVRIDVEVDASKTEGRRAAFSGNVYDHRGALIATIAAVFFNHAQRRAAHLLSTASERSQHVDSLEKLRKVRPLFIRGILEGAAEDAADAEESGANTILVLNCELPAPLWTPTLIALLNGAARAAPTAAAAAAEIHDDAVEQAMASAQIAAENESSFNAVQQQRKRTTVERWAHIGDEGMAAILADLGAVQRRRHGEKVTSDWLLHSPRVRGAFFLRANVMRALLHEAKLCAQHAEADAANSRAERDGDDEEIEIEMQTQAAGAAAVAASVIVVVADEGGLSEMAAAEGEEATTSASSSSKKRNPLPPTLILVVHFGPFAMGPPNCVHGGATYSVFAAAFEVYGAALLAGRAQPRQEHRGACVESLGVVYKAFTPLDTPLLLVVECVAGGISSAELSGRLVNPASDQVHCTATATLRFYDRNAGVVLHGKGAADAASRL